MVRMVRLSFILHLILMMKIFLQFRIRCANSVYAGCTATVILMMWRFTPWTVLTMLVVGR